MSEAWDAVFLDFYGTVTGGDRRAVERACFEIVRDFRLDLSPAQFAVAWGEQFFAMIDRHNGDGFLRLKEIEYASLRATLGGSAEGAELEPYVAQLEAYWADPPIHEDAREFLAAVAVPVCCVSNADTLPLEGAIRRHDLPFAAVVTSESARSYKPHSGIFRAALEAVNAAPERTLHIGDSLHSDVAGATGAGLRSVWVCRDDRIHDIGRARPDYTVSSLLDAVALIQKGA